MGIVIPAMFIAVGTVLGTAFAPPFWEWFHSRNEPEEDKRPPLVTEQQETPPPANYHEGWPP